MVWLEHSLVELDRAKRMTIPADLLRQQQGAAQAVAELIAYAQGKQVTATSRTRPIPALPGWPHPSNTGTEGSP